MWLFGVGSELTRVKGQSPRWMEFGSPQDWILEHPIPFVGAGLSHQLPVVCVCPATACGTEMPRLVGLHSAVVSGGRCGAELCGHSSTPPELRAFSAQLALGVVNLHRSLSSRIHVPTASPGAPCRCSWEGLAEEPPSPAPVPRACLPPLLPALMCSCVRTRARFCHPFAKGESGVPKTLGTTCCCSTSCIIRTDNPCLENSWKLDK